MSIPRLRKALALCLPIAALLCLVACNKAQSVTTRAPTPVQIAVIATGPAQPPLEVVGIVAARDEQKLAFKVGGVVRTIGVREGDKVIKGQVLAQIELAEVDAQVEQARQMANKAKRDLERGEALHADQVIALEALQNLRTQADVASAQLRAASFNRGYAAITASGDGVVLRRLVEEHELIAPGQTVLVVGRNDGGYVARFSLSDRDLVKVHRDDKVEVQVDAWPGEVFAAAITEIAGAAEARSGLFDVEAKLATTKRSLATGLVARLRVTTQPDVSTLPYVPLAAVLAGEADTARVFVVDGKVAHTRTIKVAFITADSVAVNSGLTVGERVITAGAAYVEDGETVAIKP
jgi:membrane fusion protein, multidrug efflux system